MQEKHHPANIRAKRLVKQAIRQRHAIARQQRQSWRFIWLKHQQNRQSDKDIWS
ncbi:hypothetical protein [Moraxella oculi]|uniref:Uncharacterized protein n=1 Tax=Moraxella oculi TaxID=2940516 RepID=A0ABW8U3Z6_9GAMM